jgi:hypothetical protein
MTVPYQPDMRASDSDREKIAARLRDAHAEGRLTITEFQDRLDALYKAQTYGELEPLVRDLPVVRSPRPSAEVSKAAPASTKPARALLLAGVGGRSLGCGAAVDQHHASPAARLIDRLIGTACHGSTRFVTRRRRSYARIRILTRGDVDFHVGPALPAAD